MAFFCVISVCTLESKIRRVLRHDAKRLGLHLRSDGSVTLKVGTHGWISRSVVDESIARLIFQELVSLSFFKNHGFGEKLGQVLPDCRIQVFQIDTWCGCMGRACI